RRSLHNAIGLASRLYPSASIVRLHVPATSEIYPLSLHDALPISMMGMMSGAMGNSGRIDPQLIHQEYGRLLGNGEQFQAGYQLVDRKSTRLNSSHVSISYAVFCLKKKMIDQSQA